MAFLAEIPYPQIDPVIVRITEKFALRWYGVSYILAFAFAWLVLRGLAKRGRFPVPADRVGDVLFWGILGVFLGGRIGWMIFYADDRSLAHWFRVWEGGMSFHGGLLGVVVAYFLYSLASGIRFRDLADGLSVATGPGIVCVRIANFVNGELYGRPWDGPWSMRFPSKRDIQTGEFDRWTEPRHPSQIYQALLEGLLLFLVVRWLMIKRGWGGGKVACAFLVGYGALRFVAEFFREPDENVGYVVLRWKGLFPWFYRAESGMTEGQWLCAGMVVAGVVAFLLLRRRERVNAAKTAPPPVA